MSINTNGIGFDISIAGLELALYVGDIYLKIPHVLELAWNNQGFYWG